MERYFEFRYTLESVGLIIFIAFTVLFFAVWGTVVIAEKISDKRLKKRLIKKYPSKK